MAPSQVFLKGYEQIFSRVAIFQWVFLLGPAKYFLTGGWSQAKNWIKQAFQMLVMRWTISFPNGIGTKSRKYAGTGCSPAPSAVKKPFSCHVSECLCKWLDWVYQCEDFTLHFITISLINYWDQVNSWNSGMVHNIDNKGREIGLRIYLRYCSSIVQMLIPLISRWHYTIFMWTFLCPHYLLYIYS